MKKLLLSAVVLSAMSLPLAAQDNLFQTEITAGSVRASDLIGARIYVSETPIDADAYAGVQDGWNDIGEVNEIVVARDGTVDAVLVDIGGFLGVGERQVAVDMAALRFVSDDATADNADDWFLVMMADQAMLEAAPDLAMTGAGATDPATVPDATVAETDTTMADGTDSGTMMREGYTTVVAMDLTADVLQGAVAYDANDANVGEVGELLLGDDGQVQQIVIDVGGFLGMGEKPVALSLDQVEILRQTDGSDLRVYVTLTKEELEALPAYQM
jgi:hypothetical protein